MDTGFSIIAVLAKAIFLQTNNNQANLTKMLEILEKHCKNHSNPCNGVRNSRQLSYYCSHGQSDNTAHTSFICKNKKDGHIDEAV